MEINQKNYKKFKEEHNINEFGPLLPVMGTAPVFASMFFGLRGMANLPVESLHTGGTLWFTNLAVADPIFMLPVMTCTSLFLNVKVGGDGADTLPPAFKTMLYILPIISLPVMCQFPAVSLEIIKLFNNAFACNFCFDCLFLTYILFVTSNHQSCFAQFFPRIFLSLSS